MARFQKRRALVTGAAGGIGSALVRMLMDEGARVAAADRDISNVNATATRPGDLLDRSYADELPATAHDALGVAHALINISSALVKWLVELSYPVHLLPAMVISAILIGKGAGQTMVVVGTVLATFIISVIANCALIRLTPLELGHQREIEVIADVEFKQG